jgi:hypothetical protein
LSGASSGMSCSGAGGMMRLVAIYQGKMRLPV